MLTERTDRYETANKQPVWRSGLQKIIALFRNNFSKASVVKPSTPNWMDEAPQWLLEDIGVGNEKVSAAQSSREQDRNQKALRQAGCHIPRRMG